MGPAVVVVVDDECAEEVAGGREGRDGVAVLLAGGDWEEAESLLVRMVEVKRLRHDPGSAATEVAVRQPRGVERIRGVGRTSTVDVIRQTFEYEILNILNKRNEVLSVWKMRTIWE